jgi:hypothetical protein
MVASHHLQMFTNWWQSLEAQLNNLATFMWGGECIWLQRNTSYSSKSKRTLIGQSNGCNSSFGFMRTLVPVLDLKKQ